MKFTKEEALEQLKSELTKGGKTLHLSDRTINGHIDDLIPLLTNDETELSDFISKAFPFVKRADANFEKEKADFIKSYKPATSTETQTVETKSDKLDDPLAEMRKKLEEMEKEIKMEKREKAIGNISSQLKQTMKTKGIKDEKWIDKYLSEIAVSEELDVEAKATSALEIYNLSKASTGSSTTPLNASGTSTVSEDNLWNDVKQKVKQNG